MLRPLLLPCLILFLVYRTSQAQRYPLTFLRGSTEAEQLELIEHQVDTIRKLQQMDNFLQLYPTHRAVSYLLEWLQSYYARNNKPDKVLQYGARLLTLHPEDFDAVYRMHQAAGQKQDPVLIQEWEARLLDLSEKLVSAPQPAGLDTTIWKQSVEVAKGLLAQREHEQFSRALEASGAKNRTQLLEEFIRKYPDSPYTGQAMPHLMNAYRSTGDAAKAQAVGEKLLSQNPNDPDVLLVNAQMLQERRQHPQKIHSYATRVLNVVNRPKPANYSDVEWEKRKAYYLGSAHLLIGNLYVAQNNYAQADKSLRQSLAYMKGTEEVEAAILFHIGWANYHMENYREAAVFFRQCTVMAGPFSEQANRNLSAMKTERRLVE